MHINVDKKRLLQRLTHRGSKTDSFHYYSQNQLSVTRSSNQPTSPSSWGHHQASVTLTRQLHGGSADGDGDGTLVVGRAVGPAVGLAVVGAAVGARVVGEAVSVSSWRATTAELLLLDEARQP